ncbi:MAG: hypothetical protein PUP93_08360 [Rhizonema sp. NSF051]|nr:hypothetical protein [Rhizonema sp. NSF051]
MIARDGTAENRSIINTFTVVQGNTGNLTLSATDSVNINGSIPTSCPKW